MSWPVMNVKYMSAEKFNFQDPKRALSQWNKKVHVMEVHKINNAAAFWIQSN